MNLKATSLRAIALAILLGTAACAAPSQLSAKKEQAMPSIHSITSRYSFDDTVARLQATFLAKGMSIFGIINHQAAAQESGLSMQPATVIVFGTPKAGTPLMIKDPEFALQSQSRLQRYPRPDSRQQNQFFRRRKQLGQCGKTDCKNGNGISRSKISKGRLKTGKRFFRRPSFAI